MTPTPKELLASSHEQFTFSTTNRGFAIVKFSDLYGEKCSLQQSSLASEDAIWLGIDDPQVQHLVPGKGWQKVELPPESMVTSRMHLTRDQVENLLPLLQSFVDTGDVPSGPVALASAPAQPVAMTDEQIEAGAKAIFQKLPGWCGQPWVEGGNSLKQDEARSYARAAFSAQPEAKAQAVPEGWKLVPEQSSAAMEWAWNRAECTFGSHGRKQPMDPHSEWKTRYAAMLAAAPQPPAKAQAVHVPLLYTPQPPIEAQAVPTPPHAAHPIADVICAWANGFRVEFRYRHTDNVEDSETIYLSDPAWHLCGPQYSAFSGVNEHRIHAGDLDAWECFKRSAAAPQPPAPSEQRKHVVTLVGVDEYGPLLEWATHWVDLPRGSKLFAEVKP